MKKSLVSLLRCVNCASSDLSLSAQGGNGHEVEAGAVSCQGCGNQYEITRGILRTVPGDSYTASFSLEWQLHRKTQLDNEKSDKSARTFARKTCLATGDLVGKRVLDVGIGAGRYADIVSRAGAELVGIDLSYAVETAMDNVGRRSNVNIIQSDLFNLPFAEETFDIIYSIGVLHHTPDCRRAFLSLVPYLRPGGTIVIWVYNGHVWEAGSLQETVNRFWRSLSTRLPSRLLYVLCVCQLPLYFVRRIPGADRLMHLGLPGFLYHAIPRTNRHPSINEHIPDTFDWYSPEYQSKHTYPEVFMWFEEAGLEKIRILPHPVAVSGQRPCKRHDPICTTTSGP